LKTNKYFENRPDPLTLLPNELLILNIFRRFDSHGTFQVVYISKLSHVQNSNLQCKFTKIQPFFGINFTYIPGQIYCISTWTDITQWGRRWPKITDQFWAVLHALKKKPLPTWQKASTCAMKSKSHLIYRETKLEQKRIFPCVIDASYNIIIHWSADNEQI